MANLLPASMMIVRDTFRVSAALFLNFLAYAMSVALLLIVCAIVSYAAFRLYVAVVELLKRTGAALRPRATD